MPVRGEAIGQFLGGSEPNANITQVKTHNRITVLIILEKAVYIYIYICCVCVHLCIFMCD